MEHLLARWTMFVHITPARQHQYWKLKIPVVQGKVICYKADKNFCMLEHELAEMCSFTGFISISHKYFFSLNVFFYKSEPWYNDGKIFICI